MYSSNGNSKGSVILHERASAMRFCRTMAETMVKKDLESRGFLSQIILYSYIADYYHPVFRIVVELDGGIHAKQKAADRKRDKVMMHHGIEVYRFNNKQIYDNHQDFTSFLENIDQRIASGEKSKLKSTKPLLYR